jgi:hypothetical protein
MKKGPTKASNAKAKNLLIFSSLVLAEVQHSPAQQVCFESTNNMSG